MEKQNNKVDGNCPPKTFDKWQEEERTAAQRELELYKYISRLAINGAACAEIREAVVQKISLTGEQAEEEIRKVLED